jgi:hypothetical protein
VSRGKFPQNPTVIGIATEKVLRPMCSYDFCYLHLPDWSRNDETQAAELQREAGLFANATYFGVHADEYPRGADPTPESQG